MNPRQLEKMAKKMGLQSTEIEAEVVIIKTRDTNIIIRNPSVARINMMGQETFQISGDVEEEEPEGSSDADVDMVAERAGVSREDAREALQKYGGIAESIVGLKDEK
ncbi:MAG: nascent polypeptide-associated complex protein [Candidatus Aenigmarchaeota archaeon]|nr:nascent polypeptide-associated complex protein [Candidatus Aenigmarchaeota archaeon]